MKTVYVKAVFISKEAKRPETFTSIHFNVNLELQNVTLKVNNICDRFWGNRPKRGKQFFSVKPYG